MGDYVGNCGNVNVPLALMAQLRMMDERINSAVYLEGQKPAYGHRSSDLPRRNSLLDALAVIFIGTLQPKTWQ